MAKIYYVGDWAVLTGPVFAETPFYHSPKGLDIFNYGKWLKGALESTGKHQVESVPAWDFYNKLAPGDYERILAEYDVLVFSDVDAKLFQLAPNFFDREKFGSAVLTYPDRIRLTVEAIKDGKAAMFLGGWYSFTGELGKGGWGRTRLREVLPVRCLDHEDLVESTEGFDAELTAAGERFFKSVNFRTMPPSWATTRRPPSPRAGFSSRSGTWATPCWPSGAAAAAGSWPSCPIPPRTGASTSSSGRTTPRSGSNASSIF